MKKQTESRTKRPPKAITGSRWYKTYLFKDKDPIIDEIRTLVVQRGLTYEEIEAKSGVRASTLVSWFTGPTLRPQFATIAAVVRALGGEIRITSARRAQQ